MIIGYCKEGKVEEARDLFDEIQFKDDACWNAMLTGYAQSGRGEEALELHLQKLKIGLHPDNWTLVSVLMACSTLSLLKDGRQAHLLIIKHGFESNVSIYLVSWNTIVAAFSQHGLYGKAIAFFNQMRLSGFEPDGITFLSILSACARAGKVNESTDLFESMVNSYGISPTPEHYACLVDVLSRAGQLEKACKMIQEMPFKADFGIWGALLAAAGKWNDVVRVRSLMREHGVKKEKAYSWT
ncbi:pentatricopeptide repeat-containing protein At4g02750-like [Argentina anserina]|uniref:pentatricopeptide repeat-containing protein At4g02750-like n=1 Tax=Argentina anserina TaxID=57926 RepID=UPI002176219A|nr:pentatricopeptide repeat-containing protein At4g02750-like [Potentilla anserina]